MADSPFDKLNTQLWPALADDVHPDVRRAINLLYDGMINHRRAFAALRDQQDQQQVINKTVVSLSQSSSSSSGGGDFFGPPASNPGDIVVFADASGKRGGDSGGPPAQTLALIAKKYFQSYDQTTGLFTSAQPFLTDDQDVLITSPQNNDVLTYDSTTALWKNKTGSSGVNVNGSVVTSPNFNDTTPAAQAGYINAKWQHSGSNISVEIDSTLYTPATRRINTTAPMTGGGALSTDLTLAVPVFVASGASHASGIVPDPGSTAGATRFLREDASFAVPPGGGGSAVIPTPPALASFTWVNQGSSTAAQNGGSGTPILVAIPRTAALNWRLLTMAQPATPYHLSVVFKCGQNNSNSSTSGIYFRDSVGGKMLGLEILTQASVATVRVERITNVTTDSSTQFTNALYNSPMSFAFTPNAGAIWRLRNNGTTLFADWSFDGYNWSNWYSEAVGTWLTPDSVGIGGVAATGSASDFTIFSFSGWDLSAGATL